MSKIYFTFGRFQPPHSGHAFLINKVIQLAKENNADYRIFVSSSLNKPNWKTSKAKGADVNPLPVDIKIHFLEKMFPGTNFIDGSIYGNNVMNFIKVMKEQGYTDITGVFGGVRADEFKKLFDKYEPETQVIKLERDEEKSISATKMRLAAFNNPAFFNEHALIGNMQATDIDELRNIVKSNLSFGKLYFGKSKRSLKSVLLDIIYLKK